MEFTDDERNVLEEAISRNGSAMQILVLFEEMSELQKAICKAMRYSEERARRNIAEEIADVTIMLEQTKIIFNVEEDAEMWKRDKIIRLRKRLKVSEDADEEENSDVG